MARKFGLLVLLPVWTLWVHAAGAVPKVLCFGSENQVRIETSVNGSCQAGVPQSTDKAAVEGQSTCGDCADLALALDVVKCRIDVPRLAETHAELSIDPPGIAAASDPGRDDLLLPRQFLRQRTLVHHPFLSRPGTLPLIC